jgi:Domain of unknown function (DUF4386)
MSADVAYLAIRPHVHGFGTGLVYFGVTRLLRGYLVFNSTYCPRMLGLLLAAVRFAHMVNSAALLVVPSLASAMLPAKPVPAFIGEGALGIWLIVKGVDVRAWRQRVAGPDRRVMK